MMSKRMSYTVSFKLKAIELAEATSNRNVGKQLGMCETLVQDWRKKKKLPIACRVMRLGREAHWPELEDRLHEWVLTGQALERNRHSWYNDKVEGKVVQVTYTPIKIEIKFFCTKA